MSGTNVGNLLVRLLLERDRFRADMRETVNDAESGANRVTRAAGAITDAVADAAQGQVNVASMAARSLAVLGPAAAIATAAAVAVGVAYHQAGKEQEAFNRNIILTGNAAGVTAGQLSDMARRLDGVVGTQSQAAATLAQMTGTAHVVRENLEKVSTAAIEMERASVQSIGESVKVFGDLGKEPVKASVRLNEELNYLTASTYRQIKAAEDLGDKEKAASIAQNAYADAMRDRSAQVAQHLGTLEKAWRKVRDLASEAWDAMLNVGREQTNQQQLEAKQKEIAQLENRIASRASAKGVGGFAGMQLQSSEAERELALDKARLEALGAQAAALYGKVHAEKAAADAERERLALEKAGIDLAEAAERALPKASKQLALKKELAEAEAKYGAARHQSAEAEKDYQTVIAAIQDKYKDKSAARTAESERKKELNAYQGLMAAITAKVAAGEAELAQTGALTESQKLAVKLDADLKEGKLKLTDAHEQSLRAAIESLAAQEREQIVRKGELKLAEQIAQARQDEVRGIDAFLQKQASAAAASLNSVKDRIASLQEEERAASLATAGNVSLAEAVELVAIARLEEKAAGFYENSEGWDSLQKEINARKELLGLIRGAARREAGEEANRKMLDEWKATVDKYDDVFRTGFADMLNAGRDGWKSFTRSLATTFKTTVADQLYKAFAQPFVVNVVGNLLGLTGALGSAAAASAGSSALSTISAGAGVVNAGSALGGLGAVGGAIQGFGTAMLASVQSLAGITGTTAQMVASLTAAGHVAAPGVAAGVGAFNAIPGWGWALAGVAALASIFSKKSTPHMGAASSFSASAGLQSNADLYAGLGFTDTRHYDAQVEGITAPLATAIGKALDGIAVTFGQKAGYEVAAAFADDSSKDGAWGNLRIRQGDRTVAEWGNTDGDKWAGITLSDGEAGVKEFMARAASTVKSLIADMDLPGWARRIADSMPDDGSMDDLTQVLAAIAGYPAQLLQQYGTSRDALVQQFAQGLASGDAQSAGQSVADTLVASIQNALYTNAAAQVFDIVNQGIVAPILDAMATGASVSEALSEASIQSTIERAKEQAQKLAALYGDEEFKAVLESLRSTVGSALGGAGAYIQALPNSLAAAEAIDSAAQDAASAAEEARKAWQEITDGLLSDRFDADMALLRALGREEEALAAERLRAIEGYDDYQVALYDGTREILGQVKALEAQAQAAEEARQKAEQLAATLASELPGVIDQYLNPQERTAARYARIASDLGAAGIGVSAADLASASKDQIAQAAVAVYNLAGTSDEARLAIVRAAGALATLKDEAAAAAAKAADAERADMLAQLDRAWRQFQASYNARKSVLQETVDSVQAVFGAVGDAARSLYMDVASTAGMLAAQGRSFIADAALAARTTGVLPDAQDLRDAISAATDGLRDQVFATQFDADRERLILAGHLEELKETSGGQLSEAERQLAVLEDSFKTAQGLYDTARSQLDASYQQIDATLSVVDALGALRDTISGFALGGGRALGGGGGGGGGGTPAGGSTGGAAQVLNGPGGSQYDARSDMFYAAGTGLPYRGADLGAAAAELVSAGRADEVLAVAVAHGVTSEMLARWTGVSAQDLRAYAAEHGVPAFAGGGWHAGGLAKVGEQGEELVYTPPSYIFSASDTARILSGGGGGAGGGRLEALMANLVGLMGEVRDSNRSMADEQSSYSENGNGVRSEIMNVDALARAIKEAMAS